MITARCRSCLALAAALAAGLLPSAEALSQESIEDFIAVQAPTVALTNVKVIDGTGGPALEGQTIVIRDGRIADIGPADEVAGRIANARILDLAGHTVIPGLIGLHNHSYYTGGNGRAAQLSFSGSRLYLASGVTTIRTTGARRAV